MKILIVGASSFLGSRIYEILKLSFETYGTYNNNCKDDTLIYWNSSNYPQLLDIINRVGPSIVINCIALADVDLCESLPEKSYILNALVPYNLGKICHEQRIKLVHISTDHFENINRSKLSEAELPTCVNVYSHSKLLGDSLLLAIENSNTIIVRANFFHFDFRYKNKFINKFVADISQGRSINGLVDIVYTPVSTTVLVDSIVNLIALNFSGLINVAANSPISKYDFLVRVSSILGKDANLIAPITLSELKLTALRPKNMSLDNSLHMSIANSNMIEIDEMIKQELQWIK